MKAKEIRELNTEDLIQKERNFKKEMFDLNYKRKMGGGLKSPLNLKF